MGFYQRHVLPRLTDLAMRTSEIARYRERIVPLARGRVLEIGAGSGLNLPYYGPQVEQLFALDKSPELLRMTRARVQRIAFDVRFLLEDARGVPLPDRSVDTVLTTFTLCSIVEATQALREARRVLKPGGLLLFAEHGLAPDANVQTWQRRLSPAWSKLAGGCRLDRRIDALIATAGFSVTALAAGYAQGARPFSYMYVGQARATACDRVDSNQVSASDPFAPPNAAR
jgi:ubiquinone/menaquinone biosynthesis C-methylase UbiE